jgi:chitin synthase
MANSTNSITLEDTGIQISIHDSRTIASLAMIGIIVLTCMSSIAVEKFWNRPLRTTLTWKKKRSLSGWFRLKRWILLALLLTINAGAILIVYLFGGVKATMTIIVVARAKDIICTVILPFYYAYKIFTRYNTNRPLLNGNGKIIVSIIPVYKEKLEEIVYTMDSIIYNSTKMYQMLVIIICDGYISKVDSLIDTKKSVESSLKYRSWKDADVECEVVYGYRGGMPLIIVKKDKNMEKKDSLILAYDLFSPPRRDAPSSCISFRTSVIEQIKLSFQIDTYDYIFFTDADSFIETNSLTSLIDELEYRKAEAACGLVMIDFKGHCGGFWNIYQNFQYIYGQYVRRSTENIIAKLTCLPGCITMIKINNRIADVIFDYAKAPIQTDLVQTTVQRLGTDRRLTHLFLKHHLRTCMVDSAVCYTTPPQNWYRLLAQRRRWGSNAFFNSLLNLWSMKIHLLVRISSLFDLIKMSLVFFRLFNIGLFIYQLTARFEVTNFFLQLILVAYPLLYFFLFSFCKRRLRVILHKIFIGFIINILLAGLLSAGIMATVYYNIGNFSWGPVDSVSKKERQSPNIFIIPFSQLPNENLSITTVAGKKHHWSRCRRVFPL